MEKQINKRDVYYIHWTQHNVYQYKLQFIYFLQNYINKYTIVQKLRT